MSPEQTLLALFFAHLAIAVTPGANMVLVLQNALHDRNLGIMTAAGIWPVGVLWAITGLMGLGSVFIEIPKLISAMYLLCGFYLLWIGIKYFQASFKKQVTLTITSSMAPSRWRAFRTGVLVNVLNPKSFAYWASVFVATNATAMPRNYQIAAVIMMPSISFIWYSTLSCLASHKHIRQRVDRARDWLDRIAGLVMIVFGLMLLGQLIGQL